MKTILTQDEYQNQFVDFYKQTLGTGIGTTVGPVDDDEEQDDGSSRPAIRDVGGGDVFNPMAGTNLFTGGPSYNATNISAGQYVRDNAKSARKSMDKSDSGFFKFNKSIVQEQFKQRPGETVLLGTAGAIMGAPIAMLGAVTGEMNRRKQYENAVSINATGGGNMMNLNGQTVSRVAGSKQYIGTLGNFTSEQIYAIEELGKGYIPGTMVEKYEGPQYDASLTSEESGTYTTTGKQGLLSPELAKKHGGNFDAYGNWHSTKYGTITRSAPMGASIDLAKAEGVYTEGMDIRTFSTNWKENARAGTRSTAGGIRGFFDNLRSNPLRDSTIDQYKTQLEKTRANIRSYGSGQQDESDGPQSDGTNVSDQFSQRVEEQGRTDYFDDVYDDGDDNNDSGGGVSFSGGTGGTADFGGALSGARGFADGGRIGMQAGGTAPAGFVQGPPGQFSEKETVADDQPMEVPEGTFIINAPAVEHAGSQDIRKMILDAYTVAREKGIDIGRVDRKIYEESIDVALSKGEVIVPPQIAKIIGYDRLEKINNRGKKEVSRRQKASEGGFLGLAEGGSVYDYEDPIILDEVKRKMEEMISSAQQQGMTIESYYDLDPYGLFDKEELRQAEEKVDQFTKKENMDPKAFGPFFGDDDYKGEGPFANVPRTPSLFNLFVTAEEIAHASGREKNFQFLANQPGMTNEEALYNEELRAKRIAYETVRGLLPKGKRTAQYTVDNYGYNFLEHIRRTTPEELQSKVIASMAEKYPELQDLIDSEERIARSQRAKQAFEQKASGGFINK